MVQVSTRRVAGLAAGAIVVLWGGILVIAAIERRLPDAQQWYGHLTVHLWTAAAAATIATIGFAALHDRRIPARPLRRLVGATAAIASFVAIAGVLDAVGAYPTLRAFHDRVNAVAAPAGWVLLASLVTLVIVGSVIERRAEARDEDGHDRVSPR
jgi:hypothetical protein